MRNVAVCGRPDTRALTNGMGIEDVDIGQGLVPIAVVRSPEPGFERHAPANARRVLVRVHAFSCNFRDKAFILMAAARVTEGSFYVVGSEFAGEVLDVGDAVGGLKVGDRVIGNNRYTGPGDDADRWLEGLATCHAAREYQILDERKLQKIPEGMPMTVAAAFGVGSQTAYSMLRKADLRPGARVLVTAARSNTSLFALNALRGRGAHVYVTTTSPRREGPWDRLGVEEIIHIDPSTEPPERYKALQSLASGIGRFDCVIDPFLDSNFAMSLSVLAAGGTYITCGLAGLPGATGPIEQVLQRAIIWNYRIIGSCLGSTEDLERACVDYAAGRLEVIVDSVFTGGQIGPFLHRTFSAPDRFGKVVYEYASAHG